MEKQGLNFREERALLALVDECNFEQLWYVMGACEKRIMEQIKAKKELRDGRAEVV
jgi:hypothetical protein